MKILLSKISETFVILLSIFTLGLFIPLLTAIFVAITTTATISQGVSSVPFWIFTIIGWIVSACYINYIVTIEENK